MTQSNTVFTQIPAPIPGSKLPGPFPVGKYALQLRERLRTFKSVQLFGEVFNFGTSATRVYFELRDANGALPCSMWLDDFKSLELPKGTVSNGTQVVIGGHCDYYPGSATASPSFSFTILTLRLAGEGELLAALDRLRKLLHTEGLFEPQKRLQRSVLPHTIGIVTGESGKARDDIIAALRRRHWGGRVVWGFAPVQDRFAAPRIRQAITELASLREVEVIVVARGGGSLADLFAFCDEELCRTVALLPVPVIASIGHHTDRTLLDDVAAVSTSTPTHAAEEAVPLDCALARKQLAQQSSALARHSRRAILDRARTLHRLARAPNEHLARYRRRLHQQLRELRATTRRGQIASRQNTLNRLSELNRKAGALASTQSSNIRALNTTAAELHRSGKSFHLRRRRELENLRMALQAHDSQQTLRRGYAIVEDQAGEVITSAHAARAVGKVSLQFHDGRLNARVEDEEE